MMRHSLIVGPKLFRVAAAAIAVMIFLTLSENNAKADDREDARDLVGKWASQDFLGFDIEFKAGRNLGLSPRMCGMVGRGWKTGIKGAGDYEGV